MGCVVMLGPEAAEVGKGRRQIAKPKPEKSRINVGFIIAEIVVKPHLFCVSNYFTVAA
jgi:hypothetical protein